ncbi:BTB/POZ domain-containing protein, partial [archaeon]
MSFWFNKKKEEKTEESENDEEHDEDHTPYEVDETKELDADIEAFFSPSDNEKKLLLANFDNMRKESLFCDVAFICNGVLFRAHKVVLSSWSRWMRAFLADSPNEEVLALDIFTPEAFRSVLDYMYGQPLHMTLDAADGVIKVTRRLELAKLEQGCWRYLMTILEPSNAAYLHELADRYDCPPLKLASWKILQHHVPGMENFPNRRKLEKTSLADGAKHLRGTGLMGPGDVHFSTGLKRSQVKFLEDEASDQEDNEEDGEQAEEHDEDKAEMPSVFDDYDAQEEDESEYDDGRGEDRDVITRRALEQLARDAPATEVIMAWARRLKGIIIVFIHHPPFPPT